MELRIARTGLYEIWPELARAIDLIVKETNPTEPMCVYCGWGGEGLAEHERDCKPMWAVRVRND